MGPMSSSVVAVLIDSALSLVSFPAYADGTETPNGSGQGPTCRDKAKHVRRIIRWALIDVDDPTSATQEIAIR